MKRTAMHRRTRPTGPDARTRSLVLARDDHRCVICGEWTTQLHHRLPRGRGGGNDPSNLIAACGSATTGCHAFIESRRAEAYDLGYLVPTRVNPAEVPVHIRRVGRVLLDPLGVYLPVPEGVL